MMKNKRRYSTICVEPLVCEGGFPILATSVEIMASKVKVKELVPVEDELGNDFFEVKFE